MKTLEEVHAEATKGYTAEQWEEHNREYEAAGHRIDLAQLFYDARTEASQSTAPTPHGLTVRSRPTHQG